MGPRSNMPTSRDRSSSRAGTGRPPPPRRSTHVAESGRCDGASGPPFSLSWPRQPDADRGPASRPGGPCRVPLPRSRTPMQAASPARRSGARRDLARLLRGEGRGGVEHLSNCKTGVFERASSDAVAAEPNFGRTSIRRWRPADHLRTGAKCHETALLRRYVFMSRSRCRMSAPAGGAGCSVKAGKAGADSMVGHGRRHGTLLLASRVR